MSRLGWIDAPEASRAQWPALVAFATAARREGLTRVLLCGMGGSSLAPAVLVQVFGGGDVTLDVLDSTDPAAVLEVERRAPLDRTLFVIASKSGTTVETLAAYRYFAARAPATQFVAITDPGSPLEALAKQRGFRAVFAHPPDVGGRYAALTVVGMLPAALLGADGAELLARARRVDAEAAQHLGRAVAADALAGRDKLVRRPPPGRDIAARREQLRATWEAAVGCVATAAFGPRYLHSTGQLHKGGPNTGLFLVVTADDAEDVEIPEMGRTFGEVKRAQAVGDLRALIAKQRRVAHVHLTRPNERVPAPRRALRIEIGR